MGAFGVNEDPKKYQAYKAGKKSIDYRYLMDRSKNAERDQRNDEFYETRNKLDAEHRAKRKSLDKKFGVNPKRDARGEELKLPKGWED